MTPAGTFARHDLPAAVHGDVDMAVVGALLADQGRCRMLLALDDGRALPASRLAAEAAVTPATASNHLRKLLDGGLLSVEQHGRHRYYRLADDRVGHLLEVLTQLSPPRPVRSLRQDTRARALREARTCYDHLAGRLGVAVMTRMLDVGYLTGGDGAHHPDHAVQDHRTGYGHDLDYQLTADGHTFLTRLGVLLPPRRPPVRYCVDWSEQRHHLAGALGSGLLTRFLELDWVRQAPTDRAVIITDAGHTGLRDTLDLRPAGREEASAPGSCVSRVPTPAA